MATTTITRVNIFRNRGEWCYSAWIGIEFDHGDTLDASSEIEAECEVSEMFPVADVARVDDTNE